MNLPEFSVKHSIFGNMLTIFVIFGGLLLVSTMQRDTFPEIELDLVIVTTVYPNASPEEVESLITNPIEEELKDVEDIEEYSSTSVEGLSVVTIELNPEARFKERVINEIQRAVDQVEGLPTEAEEPDVRAIAADDPVIRVAVTGDVPERDLRKYGDYMKTRLNSIVGVSTVTKDGWRDEEFWVEVDLQHLVDLELSLADVSRSLAARNVNRPGGKLPTGSREVVLRTLGQFYTAEEIENVIVRSNTDGNHVRIRDIGTVKRTFEDDTAFSKVNGGRAMILGVKKRRSGDTITIADAVKQVIEEAQQIAPEGIEITFIDDASFYVKRRLRILSSNGIVGFIGVILILFLFLNFRVALITGIGIPFAFLAALMIMSVFGITINLITMFGLIIVLGMVVDDAIIVGENIFRRIEGGEDPKVAAIEGTAEVMYPVISTVLTTIAAFVPLIFAPDVMGQVLRWFPIVVMITLAASLFEVLFVMPCHVSDFVKPLAKKGGKSGVSGRAWMDRIQDIYTVSIKRALRLRYLFIVAVIVVFALLFGFAKQTLKVDIFPADLIDIFQVRVTAEQGTTLSAVDEISGRVEGVIASLPESELQDIVAFIGGHASAQGGFEARGSHYASMFVYLTPQNTRDRTTQALIDDLRQQTLDVEGVDRIEFELIEPGPPTGKPLEVKVRGYAFETLETIAEEIMAFLEDQEGVYDIRSSYERGKDELHVVVDYEEASRLGLDMNVIAQTVYSAFQGAESTIVREGDDEIVVRVMLKQPYRDEEGSLDLLTVKNNTGRPIPLSRVAHFEKEPGLPTVYHYEGDRVITVTAFTSEDVSSEEANRAVEGAFEDVPERYPGYQLLAGGEWKETKKLMTFMGKAFLVALLFIYVILAIQFDSFFQPLVVMASIPLGMIGVVIALILYDKPISIMATMGMVGMAGVVVNDAIVLVKFINDQRREHGVPVTEAIIHAGQTRLRPILLTSVTTIAGLLPIIYGIGGYEPFVAPAAIALAYGLLFATFLTLMVVPALYHIAYDIKHGRETISRALTPPARRKYNRRPHRNEEGRDDSAS